MSPSRSQLAVVLCCIAGAMPVPARQAGDAPIRDAVVRSIRLLEQTNSQWKLPCMSCHNQGMTMAALAAARRHGIPVDEPGAQAHAARTFGMLASMDAALTMPAENIGAGYAYWAADSQGVAPTLTLAAYTRKFANAQREDGSFPVSDARPPHAYSTFTATALAARAISRYMPDEWAQRRADSMARARRWLAATDGVSTEDRSFRLLGLSWTGAAGADKHRAAASLLASQQADGGWAQMPGMDSDAYSTGQALVALRSSGVLRADDKAFRRGLRHLLSTQAEDGSWRVRTRLFSPAPISPPYFESGFPYAMDQFISVAGTSWAAMALMEALPETATPARPLPVAQVEPRDSEPWMRVAMFGTTADLAHALDQGLDPNSAGKGGMTLLMFAAPDDGKLKLLLARGARADTVSKSGATALEIAAGYRGAASTVKLLLDRSAPADLARPFRAASAAGDTETMSLLAARGVNVGNHIRGSRRNESVLANAIMMNDVPQLEFLLAHGAEVNGRDDLGMTPIMWASVQHRTDIVRVLLQHGADATAIDARGFTALRHAESIRFAETGTAEALRTALAGPSSRGTAAGE